MDLDGTLLDPAGAVTPRTRAALADVADAGIDVLIVTARPPRAVDHLAGLVAAHGVVLCANGAFTYDLAQRAVVAAQCLDPAVVAAIIADLRNAIPGIAVAVETRDGMRAEPGYPPLHREDLVRIPHLTVTAVGDGVGKLLARPTRPLGPDPQRADDYLEAVRATVGDRALVTQSGSGDLAEIGPPGVTKASAVADWCAARGVAAADVWAFGDMPNDLPLLRWAGRSFAVANAHPAVLAAAAEVCGSNAEDGVAAVLERMLAD